MHATVINTRHRAGGESRSNSSEGGSGGSGGRGGGRGRGGKQPAPARMPFDGSQLFGWPLGSALGE